MRVVGVRLFEMGLILCRRACWMLDVVIGFKCKRAHQICAKNTPPLSRTVFVMPFQASTCSSLQSPGVLGKPLPRGSTTTPSDISKPPFVARWA